MKETTSSHTFRRGIGIFMSICTVLLIAATGRSQSSGTVSAADLKAEADTFFAREIAAHFGDIKTLDPPPDRVFQALTVGEFSWGSFARALAAQADFGGNRMIAGKDTARAVAEIGLIESRQGGKAFSQLYSTLALRHYGTDLSKNAVWQSMNESERKEWEKLLDPTRFYDPVKRQPINLPDNYLGVAARVAAMSWQMGVLKDRKFLDSLLDRAAEQFVRGDIFADDAPPTGRYDRYSNEYARFCWDAADIAGREDIKRKLVPSIKEQTKLWWDLVSPKGYGYNWGRSQGLVSYLDTLEIAGFLGQNPQFRPAPLTEIAALYNQAWRWVRADYNDSTHMFRVFDYGRGNYSYINPSREWQQAGTSFGKMILASHNMMASLEKEGVKTFPSAPTLPDVSRFEYFSKAADKPEGVWLYRKGGIQFTIPITVGTKPAIDDYMPFPYGFSGLAAPVEEVFPAIVPFIKLSNGTFAATDGASSIDFAADGKSISITNRKWAKTGSKSGERFENGLETTVVYSINGSTLTRSETLTATTDTAINSWHSAIPLTGDTIAVEKNGSYVVSGREGKIRVTVNSPMEMTRTIRATGDSKLSKGVLGAIPLLVDLEGSGVKLKKGDKVTWEVIIEVLK